MSEFGKSIAEYSIGYGDNVIVSIVELSDGKLLYIVKEPLLDDVGKKFRERVYRFITNDVEIIKKISSFTSFDEGYDFVKDLVQKLCKKFIGKCSDSVISSIVYYVLRDFIGYGEVDPLIRDPNIEDVTCDGHDRPIYVFHNKYEWLETNKVLSREELEKVIRRLTYRAGKEASVAQPIVEGILNPEGYRIHVVLDVVSMSGHSFTIRKFRETPYTILELINNGTLSPGVATLLWIAAENKQGMIFYGPTGSGKTTLMNAVAMLLPPELKIVTAEDTPEIRLPFHDNWVSMVTRLSSDAYVQSVTLQAQVESAMRQRPDILILGEIRSREAYSFFQAVSTGHGGLTTIHAENVESLVRRLVAPPMSVPKALVASTKLFIQIQRFVLHKNVVRKVTYVHEVEDYNPSTDTITVKSVAVWDRYNDKWRIDIKNSKTLDSIANLQVLRYEDVVEDLIRRATVLEYAAKLNLDIVSLHTLVRKYRRAPEDVYREAVDMLGISHKIIELENVEKRYV